MFFSPSRIAFINLPGWSDAIAVTDEVYSAIQAQLATGNFKLIVNAEGQPDVEPLPVFVPTAEEVFTERHSALNQDYEDAVFKLRASYPLSEVISWDKQVPEARSLVEHAGITDGTPAPATPFLDALWTSRTTRGIVEDKMTLATRVHYLDSIMTPVIADLTGRRHGYERELEAAKLQADPITALKAVVWDFTVEAPENLPE